MQIPFSRFAVLACFAVLSVSGATITFTGLSGSNADPFTGTSESGYTVSVAAGNWFQAQAFGNNVPSIYTRLSDGVSGTISLTGGTFTVQSIDLAANNGDAAYTLTGLLGGSTIFATSGTVSGHSGPFFFETIANPNAALVIDTLYIQVGASTNPSSINLDNLVVNFAEPPPPGTSVPEPGTSALLGVGLAALAVRRFSRRIVDSVRR